MESRNPDNARGRDQGQKETMGDEGTGLQEIDAGANACSVEWCPIAGLENYVACSTYLLENGAAPDKGDGADGAVIEEVQGEETDAGVGQTRSGSIVVHKLVGNSPSPPSSPTSSGTPTAGRLKEAASVSLDGGVLDAKWCQSPVASSGAGLLACATSTGRLVLYTLSVGDVCEQEENAEFQHSCASESGDNLLLSLDWSGGGLADAKIVVSQSDGALAIWRPHPSGGAPIQEVSPWHAHTLRGGVPTEAWISFFRRSGSAGDDDEASFVVSGADDGLMKGWDLRVGGGACGASPAFVCKEHGAGVTAGQWHPTLQHTFVSGSYDEIVRVWDARALRNPVSMSTVPTGGGLWRLKWHPDPERGNLLLAACMHAGMRVLDMGVCTTDPLVQGSVPGLVGGRGLEGDKDEAVVAKFTRHSSMAYGADWCRLPTSLRSRRAVIASCSFYDSLLCLWETPPLWK